MSLIDIIIVLAVIGVIWYLVVTYIPMPDPIRTIITVIAVVALCIFLLRLTGIGNVTLG